MHKNTWYLHGWNRFFSVLVLVVTVWACNQKTGRTNDDHMEGETMNSFVPSTIWWNPDTGHRDWVWSFMTGIKKEFKIYKNLKGTALLQYNLFNLDYKAPYVDRLNSRIRFEYVLKKSEKGKK